ELGDLRAEAAHLRRVNQELPATAGELRATVERQQAHIDRLVRMTVGRPPERGARPAPFDRPPDPPPGAAHGPPPPRPPPPPPPPPPDAAPPRGGGHGRRPRPADLPRERVEIDLTEAEKACPCCRRMRVRIGADVSERLDYRPASLFVRQVVRACYACRFCE